MCVLIYPIRCVGGNKESCNGYDFIHVDKLSACVYAAYCRCGNTLVLMRTRIKQTLRPDEPRRTHEG